MNEKLFAIYHRLCIAYDTGYTSIILSRILKMHCYSSMKESLMFILMHLLSLKLESLSIFLGMFGSSTHIQREINVWIGWLSLEPMVQILLIRYTVCLCCFWCSRNLVSYWGSYLILSCFLPCAFPLIKKKSKLLVNSDNNNSEWL